MSLAASFRFLAQLRGLCLLLLLISLVPLASALNYTALLEDCKLPTDDSTVFDWTLLTTNWMYRGICVRFVDFVYNDTYACSNSLGEFIKNLNEIRKAESQGAAAVLSLLPTISAILQAQTIEIWILLIFFPFGAALASCMSFGGILMPVRVKDYKLSPNRKWKAGNGLGSMTSQERSGEDGGICYNLDVLSDNIREELRTSDTTRPGRRFLLAGIALMVPLFLAAQTAMFIVELGGIVFWQCDNIFWMHVWYIAVTLTVMWETFVQLPFSEQHRLCVSSVPYDVDIRGGDSVTDALRRHRPDTKKARAELRRMGTLPAAAVIFTGSRQYTPPASNLLIVVSVLGSTKLAPFTRLIGRAASIVVFVMGTAMFASVQLLTLPVVIMVLGLIISAGVFSRAIAGWMVSKVREAAPICIIHVIVDSPEKALDAIIRILELKSGDDTKVQVEIHGHVFINQRRVASYWRWRINLRGIFAKPYDLRNASKENNSSPHATTQGYLMGQDAYQMSNVPSERSSDIA